MSISVLETVETVESASLPETVKELWDQYQLHLHATLPPQKAQQAIRLIQTALCRYTLPGWGGPVPLSERLSTRNCSQHESGGVCVTRSISNSTRRF